MSSCLKYHKHYLQAACIIITVQAALPQNGFWSIFDGKVTCSKQAMTQAVTFLILCLAACNEREYNSILLSV